MVHLASSSLIALVEVYKYHPSRVLASMRYSHVVYLLVSSLICFQPQSIDDKFYI